MSYIQYGCGDLPNHELVPCGVYPKGGISAIGILETDHTITDFTNAAQYTAAIANNSLNVIKNIRGNVPDPSPVEGDNPVGCGPDTILNGFNWTANWMDANVTSGNIDFYNQLNTRTTFLIIYLCDEDTVMVVERAVNYIGFNTVPASNKELQMFNATARASLSANGLPLKYDAPAGIFE